MSLEAEEDTSSSFSATRINSTTFVVREGDDFGERPFIYVKLHPRSPVIIVNDTGCDEPSPKHHEARFTHLRDYLENCPLAANNNRPLNPAPNYRKYIIICSHCHFDHTLGITQFLEGGTTEIIASAAGQNFIETDLDSHGLFKYVERTVPWYKVSHYAQAFEHNSDLNITFIQTPGHTPDSLAWYDHDEMHIYTGDSIYEQGEEKMEIIWPPQGNIIEWVFSMQKLASFVKSENAKAVIEAAKHAETESNDSMEVIERRVKLGAGHQTHSADAEELLATCEKLIFSILRGEVAVQKKSFHLDEAYYMWKEDGWSMFFKAPARLLDEAKKFFRGSGMLEKGWS